MKYFKNYDTHALFENVNEDTVKLFNYLNLSNKDKYIDLSLRKSALLNTFLDENYSYELNEDESSIIDSNLNDLDKVKAMSNNFKIAFGEWILENVNYLKLQSSMPTWFYLTNPSIIKNQWIIHLTDNPYSIMSRGFVHGTEDISNLGLTKFTKKELKKNGGINFGYTAEDFHKYGYDSYNKGHGIHNFKYGSGIVIFKTSGVRAYHKTDEEFQVLFLGKDVKDMMVIDYNEELKKWFIKNEFDEVLVSKKSIEEITDWLNINEYQINKKEEYK